MRNELIIRAWTDEEFRSRLSVAEQAMVPDNPAGVLSAEANGMPNGDMVIATTVPCVIGAAIASSEACGVAIAAGVIYATNLPRLVTSA